MPQDVEPIYRASLAREWRVRILAWAAVALAVPGIWWGFSILGQPAYLPTGERVPLAEEPYLWGTVMILFSLTAAGGLLLYPLMYVLRIERAGDRVAIETAHLLGRRRVELDKRDIQGLRYWEGNMHTRKHSIRTPSFFLRVAGRRLPLIVDLQGATVDEAALKALGRAGRRD